MPQFDIGIHEQNMEQCRNLISQLPGIFSAGLRFEDDRLTEIHVLASTDKNPKQISRDIESALFAAYGVGIDHRIISIAQLPSDPFAIEEKPECSVIAGEKCINDIRLLLCGIDSHIKNGVYEVGIHLSFDGQDFVGTSRSRDTQTQRNSCIAQATLNAVHEFLGDEYFSLLDVRQTIACGEPVYLTVLEYINGFENLKLIGAAMQNDHNPIVGIVHSTLDALNRCVSRCMAKR